MAGGSSTSPVLRLASRLGMRASDPDYSSSDEAREVVEIRRGRSRSQAKRSRGRSPARMGTYKTLESSGEGGIGEMPVATRARENSLTASSVSSSSQHTPWPSYARWPSIDTTHSASSASLSKRVGAISSPIMSTELWQPYDVRPVQPLEDITNTPAPKLVDPWKVDRARQEQSFVATLGMAPISHPSAPAPPPTLSARFTPDPLVRQRSRSNPDLRGAARVQTPAAPMPRIVTSAASSTDEDHTPRPRGRSAQRRVLRYEPVAGAYDALVAPRPALHGRWSWEAEDAIGPIPPVKSAATVVREGRARQLEREEWASSVRRRAENRRQARPTASSTMPDLRSRSQPIGATAAPPHSPPMAKSFDFLRPTHLRRRRASSVPTPAPPVVKVDAATQTEPVEVHIRRSMDGGAARIRAHRRSSSLSHLRQYERRTARGRVYNVPSRAPPVIPTSRRRSLDMSSQTMPRVAVMPPPPPSSASMSSADVAIKLAPPLSLSGSLRAAPTKSRSGSLSGALISTTTTRSPLSTSAQTRASDLSTPTLGGIRAAIDDYFGGSTPGQTALLNEYFDATPPVAAPQRDLHQSVSSTTMSDGLAVDAHEADFGNLFFRAPPLPSAPLDRPSSPRSPDPSLPRSSLDMGPSELDGTDPTSPGASSPRRRSISPVDPKTYAWLEDNTFGVDREAGPTSARPPIRTVPTDVTMGSYATARPFPSDVEDEHDENEDPSASEDGHATAQVPEFRVRFGGSSSDPNAPQSEIASVYSRHSFIELDTSPTRDVEQLADIIMSRARDSFIDTDESPLRNALFASYNRSSFVYMDQSGPPSPQPDRSRDSTHSNMLGLPGQDQRASYAHSNASGGALSDLGAPLDDFPEPPEPLDLSPLRPALRTRRSLSLPSRPPDADLPLPPVERSPRSSVDRQLEAAIRGLGQGGRRFDSMTGIYGSARALEPVRRSVASSASRYSDEARRLPSDLF